MPTKIFDELLSKEMTRKEFLLHLGLLIFVLTGISSVIKTLSDPNLNKKQTNANSGYGSSSYGA